MQKNRPLLPCNPKNTAQKSDVQAKPQAEKSSAPLPDSGKKAQPQSRLKDSVVVSALAPASHPSPAHKRPGTEISSSTNSGKQARNLLPPLPPPVALERLVTHDAHFEQLQLALQQAKESILITSYDINAETLARIDFYRLAGEARDRRVKIYIYYHYEKEVDDDILAQFGKLKISCEEFATHSKILAVDQNIIVCGSFNWLSAIHPRYPSSEEGSLLYRNNQCDTLKKELWKYITHYRNEYFGNDEKVLKFELKHSEQKPFTLDISPDTKLECLATLKHHRAFLEESLQNAKERVVICSPFISKEYEYVMDLNRKLLKDTAERGVKIFFVCLEASRKNSAFKSFLTSLKSPNIHFIWISTMHLKTIIVDKHTIAEGSFNWLSAVRDEDSEHHNHEVTLVIRGGNIAGGLVKKFDESAVGRRVSSAVQIQNRDVPQPVASTSKLSMQS